MGTDLPDTHSIKKALDGWNYSHQAHSTRIDGTISRFGAKTKSAPDSVSWSVSLHYEFRADVVPIKAVVSQTKDTPQRDAAFDKDRPKSSKKRISWARLLKQVFNIDFEIE